MAKLIERERAVRLRMRGSSISDIARTLQVSKSTVSGWCKDIALSENAIEKIAKRSKRKSTNALLAYSETKRRKRMEDIARAMTDGAVMLGDIQKRDVYCIGIGLYWGEGYKRGSQEFGFTNSDPTMIRFYILWLATCFQIKKSDLILRVSINQSHNDRLFEVERYWAELLQVPKEQFTKTSLIKSASKKLYKDRGSHFGTLRVKVRGGTRYRREVLGSILSAGKYAETLS